MFRISAYHSDVKKGTTTIKTNSPAEKKTVLNVLIYDMGIVDYLTDCDYSYHSQVRNPVNGELADEYLITIKCVLTKEERKLLKAYMSDYTCDDIFAFSCGFDYISGIEDFVFDKASYGGMSLAQFT